MPKKRKKLTKVEALKRAKRMAQSYVGSGTPKVKKIRNKNEYDYVFPIKGRKGNLVGYGYGTISPSRSSGSSINKQHADLIKRKRRKK